MKTLNPDNAYKYNNLISELRRQIFTGKLKEGDRLPSERKLSEIFNYSRVTIRSALLQLKEEGLVEQIQGKGSFVRAWRDDKAKNGITNGSKELNIACICYQREGINIDLDPYYNQLFLGFHRTKYQDITYNIHPITYSQTNQIVDTIKAVKDQYDGFILCGYILEDAEVKYLEYENINYINLGEANSLRRYSYVDIDNFAGFYLCTEHLIQHGRKNIQLMINNFTSPYDRSRINGYKTALKDYNIEVNNDFITVIQNQDPETAKQAIHNMLEQQGKLDGIIVFGDWTILWLMEAIKAKNLRVPEDLAIIGYDIYPWVSAGVDIKLTNVRQPFVEMAERALKILTERCLGLRDEIQISIIKPILELGESTPFKK